MDERIKVVFASLLKPVDEPRMYEKMGRSLAQTYKYDVNIIGFESKNLKPDPLITFWPLFKFPRISLQRFAAPLLFFKKILQLKPDLIILNSPDFLLLTTAYKILFGCKIIYDIRDNYYRNIIWSHNKPSLLRRIRASLIRSKEIAVDRMINRYTLAEACYLTECSFISKPVLVLENKALKPEKLDAPKSPALQSTLRLLYTGTIAESYGVLDTLPLVEKIASLHPSFEYTICGHCPVDELRNKLMEIAKKRPWIKLMLSEKPIPHEQILEQLKEAHFSLIAYRLNPSNENCMLTRIWEALAWRTPMILRKEHPWTALVNHHQAGFAIDFLNPDADVLMHKLFEEKYYQNQLPENIYWERNEKEWIELVNALFDSKSAPQKSKPAS